MKTQALEKLAPVGGNLSRFKPTTHFWQSCPLCNYAEYVLRRIPAKLSFAWNSCFVMCGSARNTTREVQFPMMKVKRNTVVGSAFQSSSQNIPHTATATPRSTSCMCQKLKRR